MKRRWLAICACGWSWSATLTTNDKPSTRRCCDCGDALDWKRA